MILKIKVEDYLNDEEIKDTIKSVLIRTIESDAERILSNMAYHAVFEAVNEAMDKQAMKIVKENTIKIINQLSSYSVFHKGDSYTKESLAHSEMIKTVMDNRDLIKSKVIEAIEKKDYERDIQSAFDYFTDSLQEIFMRGLNNHDTK